jgi:cytochrome c-type biogenesis protein CcmH
MTLWLTLAVMTAAAAFAVIWPLARHARSARAGGSDVAVYRDQLDEIERDQAAGLIGETEAQAARVEISRLLLAAADAAQAASPAFNAASAAVRRRAAAVASLVALPAIAAGLYLWLGSPELASGQQRDVATAPQSVEKLVAQAEAHLASDPRDGRAWELLAPVYMRLDRYSDAVTAWRNALQLLGENAERDANLGESLMAEANGVITAEAKADFVRAETLDNTLVTARYYLGLAAEQDGESEKAAKIWRDLIAQAPAGAAWINTVRDALARVENNATAPASGPSAAQMAAGAEQPPEQQGATIHSMVDRLAARLKQDGSDVNGWVQLVRSYKVLGEPDKARTAIADAQQALASDPGKLEQLNAALKKLDTENAAAPAPAPAPASAPSAAQMAAGAEQPPEHQDATIHSMVDRLAARLKQDGSDVNGWVQLVRSYKFLGEPDKARAATADAQQALASDPDKLEQLNAALKKLDTENAAAPAATPRPASPPTAAAGAPAGHEQGATIESMVDRLAQRLKVSGSDPLGWLMLVRSYVTLGEKDKATAAVSDARHALADDPGKLEQFNGALKNVNLGD